MVIRVYLLTIEKDIYHVIESVNIGNYLKLLDKYQPNPVPNTYLQYNVRSDFLDITDIQYDKPEKKFINLLDSQFQNYKIKTGWYHFNQNTLTKVIQFISNYLEPLPNTIKTTQATYQCLNCQRIYKDKRTFHKHLANCNCKITYTCNTCQKPFKNKNCFETHLRTCVKPICQTCGKIFSSKQALQKHSLNCGNFTCLQCQHTFNSKYKFQRHCRDKHHTNHFTQSN